MGTALLQRKESQSGLRTYEEQALAETSRYYLDVYGKWVHAHAPAKHHQVWVDRLTELVEGRTGKRKLLIIAPPSHAKSTWLSLIFPPWYLGNHPDHSVLFFTSSDAMAQQFGTTVKATLEGNERHTITFPSAACRPDMGRGWSANGLYLGGTPAGSKDPAYRAVGYGASVIGARAHGIIMDDPLTQEEAQSEIAQARAKQYYAMTVDSRLHPAGWQIAIMTRWHENDLASYLMAQDGWDMVHMPALGYWGEGSALWPECFSAEWLQAKQASMGGPFFACLYQGDPTALGGSIFQSASWFRPLPDDFDRQGSDGRTPRQRLRVVQFWDLAFSAKQTADFTSAVTVGIDASGQLYILNVWRERVDEMFLPRTMAEQIALVKPDLVGVEIGAFKQATTKDVVAAVNPLLAGRHAVGIVGVPVTHDKVFRARLPAARAQAGQVYADRRAPWYPGFEAQCLGFPLATHDDMVDALSGACQLAIERIRIDQPATTKYGLSGKTEKKEGWSW